MRKILLQHLNRGQQNPKPVSRLLIIVALLPGLFVPLQEAQSQKSIINNSTTGGTDMTVSTVLPPTVTTDAASSVSTSSATLNGTVNANNNSTTVTFEYGTTTSYGTTVTADQSPISGSTNTTASKSITGLISNTTYHFRARGTNINGTTFGADMTFTTGTSLPPTVTTDAASSVGTSSVTLNGTVNANNNSTTVTFEYGTTTAYGTTVTADQSPVTGSTNTSVSKAITGLTTNTTYHYRGVGVNASGTTLGADMTFTTSMSFASIGDKVWNDLDRNGLKGSNEPGVDGVTVNLWNPAMTVLFDTDVTAGGGIYGFSNLVTGNYVVEFVLPSGAVFTNQDTGGDDTIDSDVDPATGKTTTIVLAAGDNQDHWDAGLLFRNFNWRKLIEGMDANNPNDPTNPKVMSGDLIDITFELTLNQGAAVPSVFVNITDDLLGPIVIAGVLQGAVTGPTGDFGVPGVLEVGETWVYTKTVSAPTPVLGQVGATLGRCDVGQNDNSVTVHVNNARAQVLDFDETDPAHACIIFASIGDTVWNDLDANGLQDNNEPGVDGVTVNLWNPAMTVLLDTDVTTGGGIYGFTNLVSGNYVVEFVPPSGAVFTYQDTGSDDSIDSDADPATGKTATIILAAGDNQNHWDAGLVLPNFTWRKLIEGIDANDPNDPTKPNVSPGDLIDITFELTLLQGATVPAVFVNITDDLLGPIVMAGVLQGAVTGPAGDFGMPGILEVGETWIYTKTISAPTPVLGQVGATQGRCNAGQSENSVTVHVNNARAQVLDFDNTDPAHACIGKDVDPQIVSKTASDTVAVEGDTINYTVVVKNGGFNAATGIVVSDLIPVGLAYVTGSIAFNGTARTDADDTDNADFGITTANTVTVNIGVMAPAQQDTITFKVIVEATVNGAMINNTATVAASQDDDPNNNSASIMIKVAANINLHIDAETQLVFWDEIKKQFQFELQIINNSNVVLFSPLFVKFVSIETDPPGQVPEVMVVNADRGGTGVGAIFDYSELLSGDEKLEPGESTSFKLWIFDDPGEFNFHFFANVFGLLASPAPVAKTMGGTNTPIKFYADVKNQTVELTRSPTSVEASTPVEFPMEFQLHQNYPNPFNPETTIRFQLPKTSEVTLNIYNLQGQIIKKLVSEEMGVGFHEIVWDARDDAGRTMPSGVYLYKIQAGGFVEVRKLMLLR